MISYMPHHSVDVDDTERPRWEYRIIMMSPIEVDFNVLGDHGWEFVANIGADFNGQLKCIFKRQKR